LSFSLILIHLTHEAALHIGLTSFSENCIAFHSLVAIKILSSQVVVITQINSSSSFIHNTLNQLALIFFTCSISSFFTVPLFVTKNKYLFFSLEMSIIDAISSSFCNHIKLIIGCHLDILFVSGISYAGRVNTLPLVVKYSISE
jgi:hypothetical protein